MGDHSNYFIRLGLDLVLDVGLDVDELDSVGINDHRQIFVDMEPRSMGG